MNKLTKYFSAYISMSWVTMTSIKIIEPSINDLQLVKLSAYWPKTLLLHIVYIPIYIDKKINK